MSERITLLNLVSR